MQDGRGRPAKGWLRHCDAYCPASTRTLDNTTLVTLTLTRQLLEFDSLGNQMSARTLTGHIARVPRYRLVNGEWVGR